MKSFEKSSSIFLEDVLKKEKYSIVDGPFGSSLKKSDYIKEGVPVLQGKNITNDEFKFFDIRFISHKKAQELSRSKVVVGDILLVKIGSIGYSAEITSLGGFDYAIIPANLAKISIDRNKIDKKYLLHFLKSNHVKNYLRNAASKTAQPALSLSKIKKIPIILPSIEEQRRIANELNLVDNILKKINISNQKIDAVIKSYFNEKFLKNKNLPDVKLGDACLFIRGPFGGSLKKEIFKKKGYAVYEQKHAIYGNYEDIRYFIDEKKFQELKRFELKSGDLIMSCSGTMGKISIAPKKIQKGVINQALLKLTPNKNLNKDFLKFFLESDLFQNNLEINVHGAAIKNVASVSVLKNIKIKIPSIKDQENFSKFYQVYKNLKINKNKLFEKMLELKFSIQNQLSKSNNNE